MNNRYSARSAGTLTAILLTGVLIGSASAVETPQPKPAIGFSSPAQSADPLLGLTAEPSRGLLGSGLFDSKRLSLNSSVSYGVSSGAAGTRSSGLWLSEIGYRLSDPLHLSVDVGAVLNPVDGEFMSPSNIYLHGFNLDYRPGDKFQLSVSYRNVPANASAAEWLSRGGVFSDDLLGRPGSPWHRP